MNQLLAMRIYIRVIETGSFSRAADQLNIPRSTVSKLITDLENYLNIKLIHRTTRKISITAQGKEYYQNAVRIISDIDVLDSKIKNEKNKPKGHLRIDIPGPFAHHIMIPALPEFYQEYPDITIALGITDKAVNIIEEGVDLAIRGGIIQDLSLISRKLFDIQYMTCASPAYLDKYGVPKTPHELRKHHKNILYFSATNGRTIPLTFTRKNETIEIMDSHFSTNDGSGIVDLMLANLGISQQLKVFVQPYIKQGKLVPILQEWHRPALPFYIVYHQNKYQNARVKAFINWFIKYSKNINY